MSEFLGWTAIDTAVSEIQEIPKGLGFYVK